MRPGSAFGGRPGTARRPGSARPGSARPGSARPQGQGLFWQKNSIESIMSTGLGELQPQNLHLYFDPRRFVFFARCCCLVELCDTASQSVSLLAVHVQGAVVLPHLRLWFGRRHHLQPFARFSLNNARIFGNTTCLRTLGFSGNESATYEYSASNEWLGTDRVGGSAL